MDKLVVTDMLNLPPGETILNYVGEEDIEGLPRLQPTGKKYYLVRTVIINELIDAGVEVYFYPCFCTDSTNAFSEDDLYQDV